MEACRRLSQTARVAALWSGWKFKHTHPIFYRSKGGFGTEAVTSSTTTSQDKDVPYPLTKGEAFTFLERNLQIPPSQVYAGGKSLDFLNHVIKRMKKTVPFTNMNLLGENFSECSPEDLKFHITSGQGGTCLWIAPFTKVLLEHLGHNTYHISANNPMSSDHKVRYHLSTIVCDLSYPGSRHLVDPGIRWPLHEAVPLDFERASPEYTFHKMRTKFFQTENDTVLLGTHSLHEGPETKVICDSNGENWQIRLAYCLDDKISWLTVVGKWQEYLKSGNPLIKPFDSLLFYAFLKEKTVSLMCSDGQAHATFYNLEDYTTERITMTKTEVTEFFVQNFPQYSVQKLEKVFEASKLI